MPDTKDSAPTFVGTIHANNVGMIDFSDSCLKLGAKVPGKPVRWTELDEDDWKILWLLLTRNIDGVSAASESKVLSNLADYAEAVVHWYQTQKKDTPP